VSAPCTQVPVTAAGRGVRDLGAAELAAAALLAALGVDTGSGALAQTPARMARALEELLTPRAFDLTTFPNDEGYQQLVIERGIPFRSLCEHHFLPFTGRAYLAYLPGERILGPVQAGQGGGDVRAPPAGPGAADPAGR
jgi:GTP cyclohydrolase IA